MRKIFFLTVAIMFFSCNDKSESKDKKSINDFSAEYGIQTIDYEDCEYIIYKDKKAGGIQMLHKQNCKYCRERQVIN
tara:strand:+ start:29592 stop:29822 length:231 start_codon:yes stop_codon:yes gene_type:complete